jgi:isopentenyl diphosphate isomerase/L-lactate dehydrogenase-like FMN-dependent dehydrogenase
VDSSIASLDALQDIRAAVGDEPTVLMDSGIRTGADVFTALALGADAVLVGRPYMYGVVIAGQRGVEEVISNVVAELDLTMSLTGVRSIADINADLLQPSRDVAPRPR